MVDELEARGHQVFASMSADDKRALKHFITRQIQNVLANEHGIGGRQQTNKIIEDAVHAKFESKGLIERVGRWIINDRKIDPKASIDAAIKAEAKKAVEKVVGEAASNIHVSFTIGKPAPADAPDGWGKF